MSLKATQNVVQHNPEEPLPRPLPRGWSCCSQRWVRSLVCDPDSLHRQATSTWVPSPQCESEHWLRRPGF